MCCWSWTQIGTLPTACGVCTRCSRAALARPALLDQEQRLVDQLRGGALSLAADVPSDLSALTAANAQGRRVLVPRETWPSYECLEHNGTGWEALIQKVVSGNARVRFLYATTARGVRYAESDLELSVLRP